MQGKSNDETAFKCLEWVRKNIKYVSDKSEYGYEEFWAYAYQVLKRKKDDCDGGSILLANLMIYNNIPAWRVRINAGDVLDPVSKKPVGHAYVTYCRESDNNWVVLDWCFYSNDYPIAERKLHKEEKDYYDLWFSFDIYHSYGNKKYLDEMLKVFKYDK